MNSFEVIVAFMLDWRTFSDVGKCVLPQILSCIFSQDVRIEGDA